MGQSLSEMLASDLAKWPSLSVISREALGPVLREQWLQQRGFSSPGSAVDLGKIQGVHYLVRGGFHYYEDNLRIDLQVVDVETGVVVSALTAQGREAEIPRLEQDLVMQILTVFDRSLDSRTDDFSDGLQDDLPPKIFLGRADEKGRLHTENSGAFGLHSVHQIDARLSLERITQHRMQAYRVAATIWHAGWSTEMGQPIYRVWQPSEDSKEPIPLLTLPVVLFMQPNKITDVLKNLEGGDVPAFVNLESDGFVIKHADVTGASQLFFEQIRKPQRLFVRALNEHGELIAVFSKWSWQTEAILRILSTDRIVFQMWPQPFMSGLAEFPVSWIQQDSRHVTFDAMMVPISDERRTIVLEPVNLPEAGQEESGMEISNRTGSLLPLENWIRMKWEPPITEAFPITGYLPANKRTVVGLLHLQAGKIVKVQFLNAPHDSLFSRSLEDLKPYLLGYCLSCQVSDKDSPKSTSQTLRLQLTLVKDLHAFQFGSRSH